MTPSAQNRYVGLAFLVYLSVWTTLTHWPHFGPLPDIPGGDKTIHFLGYLGACLLLMAWRMGPRGWATLVWATALGVFAVTDECTQPWVNRTASVFDFLADAGGIVVGATFFRHVAMIAKIFK